MGSTGPWAALCEETAVTVVVTATVHPAEGRLEEVLEIFSRHVEAVHQEPGCELYALHAQGADLVVIEKWSDPELLRAHSGGAALAALNQELDGLLAAPAEVLLLNPRPAGDPAKGAL
ncbi:antibiotic biosynthesis monooxygenase [Streptacidiphilus sp. 4-A2]|nr:antibiotic biosynthesis monooxygenase [Streptacidiphilus sp. 4-A2]